MATTGNPTASSKKVSKAAAELQAQATALEEAGTAGSNAAPASAPSSSSSSSSSSSPSSARAGGHRFKKGSEAARRAGAKGGRKAQAKKRRSSSSSSSPSSGAGKAEPAEEPTGLAAMDRTQRLEMMATAIAGTFNPIIERLELEPPLSPGSSKTLAELWDPVILAYVSSRPSPLVVAAGGTAMMFLPYGAQLLRKWLERRQEEAAAGPAAPTPPRLELSSDAQ